jgi:hypothetical protein
MPMTVAVLDPLLLELCTLPIVYCACALQLPEVHVSVAVTVTFRKIAKLTYEHPLAHCVQFASRDPVLESKT